MKMRNENKRNENMFSYATFWVSNSKQTAMYFVSQFGFTIIDYEGMESGYSSTATYTLKQGDVVFIVKSCIIPNHECVVSNHVALHGDSIRDIAFKVDDCEKAYHEALERGATSVCKPHVKNKCVIATINTLTDVTHTFVEGEYIPSMSMETSDVNSINKLLSPVEFDRIDHVVTNANHMEPITTWYETVLNFHKFWSVDETQIHTKYSALRSTVMTNEDETIKLPVNEPAPGLRESQIQEYVNYHGGAGIQHVAILTRDIIASVASLKIRGVEFLTIPSTYYENLSARLSMSNIDLNNLDLKLITKYNILVDFDDQGYLLQIFTKPITSRPTLFFEIIERHNFNGFGAGNFKALFESIEIEQANRHPITNTV